jgi:hypothetical protein
LAPADEVKRHNKNDFTHHPTPHMTCPIRRRNMTTVSEMGLMITVGSAKAQGSIPKPIYGSELPRATGARDEVTQRMANILALLTSHQGDLASSRFISESRLGGFLYAPMFAGI